MLFPIEDVRAKFPSLDVTDEGRRRVYFDNPAGTQVPRNVMEAVTNVYMNYNSNTGAPNSTSLLVDEMAHQTGEVLADFLGTKDPGEVVIGPNMTTLTFQLSRGLAHQFKPGDEIILTQMDHEGNVSPWLQMANDRGLTVKWIPFNRDTWRIEPEDLTNLVSDKTRLVALNYASNLTGAVNDVESLTAIAKASGALVYIDGVQFAPHFPVDVEKIGCDFFACSPYKFFGPHLGVVWGRRELLEQMRTYKVRCAYDVIPDRHITGTQQYELIAGLLATIEYFEGLGRMTGGSGHRRKLIETAFQSAGTYEDELSSVLLKELTALQAITVYGPSSLDNTYQRVPTFAFTHEKLASRKVAENLSAKGIFCHWGHNYAFEPAKALGLDPEDGAVRVGLAHYNTAEEVNLFVESIQSMIT